MELRTFGEAGGLTNKDLAFAVLAFIAPAVLWFGAATFTIDRDAPSSDGVAQVIFAIAYYVAPPAGYCFIAFPLRRWKTLATSTKFLIAGTSLVYWLLYIPALFMMFAAYAIGRAGGI